MYRESSTAHCPQAVRQCTAGAPPRTAPKQCGPCIVADPLPTAPRPCGSVPHALHRPLPPSSAEVYRTSSIAHGPLPQSRGAMYHGGFPTPCRQAVRQCTAGVPLPQGCAAVSRNSSIAHCPKQCGSVPQDFHCPLPQGHCTARVHLPPTARQCGSVPHAYHRPLPPSRLAECRRSSTAHCPQATRQYTEGVPLPGGSAAVSCSSSTTHCPQVAVNWRSPAACSVAVQRRIPTAQCLMRCGSVLKDLSCPNAGFITARPGPGGTKAWAQLGQPPPGAKEGGGPLPQVHNRLHTACVWTHSPPVLHDPYARHPDHCHLVRAPSAPHNLTLHQKTETTHTSAQHQAAPQHNTAQHSTTQEPTQKKRNIHNASVGQRIWGACKA